MERLLGLDAQLIHDAILLGINIFILFFFMSYMFFNPVRDMLKKRQDKIKNELDYAAQEKASAEAMRADYEQKIGSVKKEADEILSEARKQAQYRENQIVAEAQEEAARILERAGHEVELEKKKAMEDVKGEIIAIASMMAGKIAAASIDEKMQDALLNETLNEIGESTWQS